MLVSITYFIDFPSQLIDIDNLLTVMNYQEGIETQEKIEALQDEMKTIDGNVLNLQDEMKAIKGDIRLILKLLSDKS